MSARALVAAGTLAAVGLAAREVAAYGAKRREIAVLRETCRDRRTLALTYDDGPSLALTPRLLDLLAEHDAHATFFPLGERAAAAPEVLDRVRAAGHEIGCHGARHVHAWKSAPWAAVSDIDDGYEALSAWVAPDGRFRPPYGKQTTLTRRALQRRGAPVAWWTIDSGDTHAALPDPEAVAARAAGEGGGVVLLHDHGDDRPAERQAFVLAVTERLLGVARTEGLRVVPVGRI